ncbi:MAG TPA: hypothetical protein VF691_11450 [Cytophagaceae bacterium]|jgi:hypothetical protein
MFGKNLRIISLIIFLLLGMGKSFSQNSGAGKMKNTTGFLKHEKLSILGGIGFSTYYGDLCDKFSCMTPRFNGGIGLLYRITNHISAKTEINYFRLKSTDVYEERNLNFRSGNVEWALEGVYDIFPYTKHFRKRKPFAPYLFLGVGFAMFNPKGENKDGEWVNLRPLRTEGQSTPYSNLTPTIPYGIGVTFKYTKQISFVAEGGYRMTFTDYIDDVSSYGYADQTKLTPEAQELALKAPEGSQYRNSYILYGENGEVIGRQQRGNPKKNDGYFVFQAKIRYVIGAKHNNFRGKHPLLKPTAK